MPEVRFWPNIAQRRWTSLAAFCVATTICVILFASTAQASPGSEPLLAKARSMDLARSTGWLRLLHYRATFWGGFKSDVDGEEFFLAPTGKVDPEAELEATIRAFDLPAVAGKEGEHAACRFPARLFWLEETLHLGERPNAPECKALARYGAASVESASVVYSSEYISNPASAFGHTFLHLKKKPVAARREANDAADYGVDYTATPDTDNPLLYAFKGLTGLFPGRFRLRPFDFKLREYGAREPRDLWEYELALSPREVTLLALHLWELSAARINFFYLTGNCSFQLIAALEAAAVRLDLLSRIKAPILPADTIKALVAVPALVTRIVYRPSLHSLMQATYREGPLPSSLPALSARSMPVPLDKAPHLEHGSMRVLLGSGASVEYGNAFATVGYRLALHDLVDPPDGEPELSQLQFLDTRLRYDIRRRVLTLDTLTFAEALALNPLSRFDKALSWRVRAFGVRLHDRDCVDCFAHGLEAALGGTLATGDEHFAVFFMAEAYAAFSGALDGIGGSFVRVGIGPLAGLRVRLPAQTVGLLTGAWSYLPGERLQGTHDIRGAIRSRLAKDVAIGLEGVLQPRSFEAELCSYIYF